MSLRWLLLFFILVLLAVSATATYVPNYVTGDIVKQTVDIFGMSLGELIKYVRVAVTITMFLYIIYLLSRVGIIKVIGHFKAH